MLQRQHGHLMQETSDARDTPSPADEGASADEGALAWASDARDTPSPADAIERASASHQRMLLLSASAYRASGSDEDAACSLLPT